ncbi:DUF167 domain-containing protein [Candidatus Bodocaedibacter vickermanii]|uniref:Uncharacterized protein n=1 Tax=Candidatus Bodocaedibacter vickermanii TaxID=2741701 RepID=A0A7L9RU95_9PROT|nr:hypothetical protein CPBP_00974 [Candidatus Paracaedibacteraceae bacterium 'Lake Konstanz']
MKPLIILLLSTLPISYGSSLEATVKDASFMLGLVPPGQGVSASNSSLSKTSYLSPPFKAVENNGTHSILQIFAIPDSPEDCLDGVWYDPSKQQSYLRVKIMTSAKKGGANNAIIRLLSEKLKIDQTKIYISGGEKIPYKEIIVPLSIGELERFLRMTNNGK